MHGSLGSQQTLDVPCPNSVLPWVKVMTNRYLRLQYVTVCSTIDRRAGRWIPSKQDMPAPADRDAVHEWYSTSAQLVTAQLQNLIAQARFGKAGLVL